MKKSSIVWRFFDRIEEDNRCVAVLCKLCETQYKYFGNTTNLRVHLNNKHPIQWELGVNGKLEDSNFRIVDEDTNASTTPIRKRTATRGRKSKNVDVLDQTDSDNADENNDATINLVRQMHAQNNSDEEWLEEDPYQITHIETYEPTKKKMKYRKIKREIASPQGLPGYYAAPKSNKTVLYEEPRKDEYSVFGEYVANKLRKFSSTRTRGNLQQLITTILWQAEYGFYDNAESVKKVVLYSMQSQEPETSATFIEYDPKTEEIIATREEPNQSNE